MLGQREHASRPIASARSNAEWIDPDYLVFAQEGVLVAQRFDLEAARAIGPQIAIADSVDFFLSTGRAMYSTSPNGTIAYHSFGNVARLAWFDRAGKEVGTVGAPARYLTVRLSPDGQTALFARTRQGIGTWDFFTTDLAGNVERRLTSGPGSEAYPVWMPEGRSVLFGDGRHGGFLNLRASVSTLVWRIRLLPHEALQRRPMDVSPDGQTLLYTERSGAGGALDILMLSMSGSARRTPLFASPFNEADRRFSPDGRAVTFMSDESGRMEVYVAPFPPTGVKLPVSAGVYVGMDFQAGARWNPNGRELFYVSTDGRLMAVSVGTAPNLQLGRPSALLKLPGRLWEDFAVSADGQRFLAVVPGRLLASNPSRSCSIGLPASSGESAADSNFSSGVQAWSRDECGDGPVFDDALYDTCPVQVPAPLRSRSCDRARLAFIACRSSAGFTRRFLQAPLRSLNGADRHHHVRVRRRRLSLHRSGTRPSRARPPAAAGDARTLTRSDRGEDLTFIPFDPSSIPTIARWRRASWIRCVAATRFSASC